MSKLFEKYTSSQEAIMFQSDSPLFKQMTQAFAEAVVYRDSIDYTDVNDRDKVAYRRAKVHNYVKSVTFKKLAKIIKDLTNITVTKIIDVDQFCGMFAVDLSLGNAASVLDIEANMSGMGVKQAPITATMQELMDFSKAVDTKNSKFLLDKFGKDNNRKLAVTLYMDVDMLLLARDNVNKSFVSEDLLPEEMAAIYIHEIGHVFTVVEYSKNIYYQYDRVTKHINSLRSNDISPTEFVDLYQKTIKKDIVKNTNNLNNKAVELLDNAETIATYYKENQGNDFVHGTLEFIRAIFTNLIRTVLTLLARYYLTTLFIVMFRIVSVIRGKMEGDTKSSDLPITVHNLQYIERLADDFVVRHGCSSYLASALAKVEKLSETSTVDSVSLRDSVVYGLYLKLTLAILKIVGGTTIFGIYSGKSYEDFDKRVRRMAQSTVGAFKNANFTAEVRNDFITEYESIIKTLNDNKKGIGDRIFDFMYALTIRWAKIHESKTDWQNEINEFDEFINNKLYYQGNKLTSIYS